MIRIFGIDEAGEWDSLVRSFAEYDVYYLSGYVRAFQIHGDGEPQLLYYEGDGVRGIYVYMKRRTALEGVFDSITPYGYGGFLLEALSGLDVEISEEQLKALWTAYEQKMAEEHVVDNFVRYHPMLGNAGVMRRCSGVIDLGKTVAMVLSSPEVIWENIHSKNRNMIRKAEKNGVMIRHGKGMELMDEFVRIYNATMVKDDAEEYYFFGREFYESIDRDLMDNYEMFWAEIEDAGCPGGVRVIAMSIMIFANGRLNYHLSGSDVEYRGLAPSNLLLYRAALWGCEQGFSTFHLGGGVGSGEDNLYRFKAAFNKASDYRFSIAKHVFDEGRYEELVEERASRDVGFDRGSGFFPVYRSLE